ncbi:hypothetical protein CSUI_011149 [Cystoisospora suis]|uniref:Uncharacterized protein n=1 Tax=Cystoisospora suis TaxID=483139 RepID=A0A2C6J6W1_9APIC|nr:hypothetical protein CSUI_011149 [Cystoisospora suis]
MRGDNMFLPRPSPPFSSGASPLPGGDPAGVAVVVEGSGDGPRRP